MLKFDGKKNQVRRTAAEISGNFMDNGIGVAVKTYRKTVLTYAAQINEPFEVDTLEGLHTGQAGDFLAVGPAGEMYPIASEIFWGSYEEVDA